MKERLLKGTRVRAFHPGMFGVVKEGEVVKVGSKYAHVDFGEMLGGIKRVPMTHVVERIS